LAEVGVILLLFTIGIEFSLTRLREMGRQVIVGGGAQVLLTVGLAAALAAGLGLAWPVALLLGFLVALSSTAIVLKGLADKGGGVARPGRVPGRARHLGVRLWAPGHGRAAAVPRRLHLPVLCDRGDAGARGVPARAPGARARRRGGDHGREERARRARPGSPG